MSQIISEVVRCVRCGVEQKHTLFKSLNGERVARQVARLVDGTFEAVSCPACGARFRPEHRMLYSHYGLRTWVAMYPPEERPHYAEIEVGVTEIVRRNVAGAPALVSAGLRGIRPRVVFGQHNLSEAVRTVEASIDSALLECAKLLAFRRNLAPLVRSGPSELCYEGVVRGTGHLQFGVHTLATGQRVDTLSLAPDALDEVAAARDELEARYPELFTRAYVSATRYLFGASA